MVVLLPALLRLRPAAEGFGALRAAVLGCLLVGAVGFFHWWSAFGMGMSVSDELPPFTGGTTPFGVVLALGGMLVGLGGVLLGVLAPAVQARMRRRELTS